MRSTLTVLAILVAMSLLGGPRRHSWAASRPSNPPDVGIGADLHGAPVFPAGDLWNKDISRAPVDPLSDALIRSIGVNKPLHPDFGTLYHGVPSGIPYVIVARGQKKVPIHLGAYEGESDKGPYPIPPDAPIEGGPNSNGDRHVIVIDRDAWILYELFNAAPDGDGWKADSGAVFDLRKLSMQRPAGWTSADAAGLPIFPGLVRYDEVMGLKKIEHALRFTVVKSRRAYVPPARHWASRSDDSRLPPMGMRVRLRADYDTSAFAPEAKVILTALKTYGMIVADNGSDWFISGAPDSRWDDDALHTLGKVKGKDFEVIKMDGLVSARH